MRGVIRRYEVVRRVIHGGDVEMRGSGWYLGATRFPGFA